MVASLDLNTRLQIHENEFNTIVNLIPAKHYLPVDPAIINPKKSEIDEIEARKNIRKSQTELGRHRTVTEMIDERIEAPIAVDYISGDEQGEIDDTAADHLDND
ncbi:hypothetical protein AYI68_g2486, partial [Smittium mucronatum]